MKLRPPSFRAVSASVLAVCRRFPLAVGSAVVGAVVTSAGVEGWDEDHWVRWAAAASLGIPLFLGISLAFERRGSRALVAARTAGVGVLLLLWIAWSNWTEPVRGMRYVQLSLAFHLCVAFLPYLNREGENGFWQYNRILFGLILGAALYTATLIGGLALALAGLDNLLGLPVRGETYVHLIAWVGFVFNTLFFAAGVPHDLRALDAVDHYPGGIRLFARSVLVPLVSVYLLILYLYLARIILTTQWPSGWIGYLVSALCALGILAFLLVIPRRREEAWIEAYVRWFWVAVLPPAAMLALAIGKRIGQYGVTERRYFLAMLTAWLAVTAVYMAMTRARRLRWIPTSLAVVALLTFAGPWSAYSVAQRSQVDRLAELLEREGMLADGVARRADGPLAFEVRREITAVLDYLARHHGLEAVEPWFAGLPAAADSLPRRPRALETRNQALGRLGIDPVERWATEESPVWGVADRSTRSAVPLTGFDLLLPSADLTGDVFVIGGDSVRVRYDSVAVRIRVVRGGTPALTVPIGDVLRRVHERGASRTSFPPDSLVARAPGGEIRFQNVSVRGGSGRLILVSGDGDIFLGGEPVRTSSQPSPGSGRP